MGQSYLYENSSGVMLYGDLTADNGYAHWLISTGQDGKQLIQNRATGALFNINRGLYLLREQGRNSS